MPTTPMTRTRSYRGRRSPRCAAALQRGYEVLEPASDKPHGLREAYILDADGYVWVPDIASLSKWAV